MKIDRIHHVAYRCRDAKETVEWYGRMLNMEFQLAIAEDQVPSTKEPDPYMHIFLDEAAFNAHALTCEASTMGQTLEVFDPEAPKAKST